MNQAPKILKLNESVINKIAAGEVIQRPANALKEMIENSLDAKSTNIQIIVKNGGLKLLQIQDNGCGIRKEDFEIVCERFTTSKLKEFEDLGKIATFGFRGEALASISHVAHLTIISKTISDKCAYKASYEDGKIKSGPIPFAATQGTQIIVEDLFYNMNVRKRALRSPSEEYNKVFEVVSRYAIHNNHVGFGLKKHGETNDIKTSLNSTKIDNIRLIFGAEIAKELVEVMLENETYRFKVSGCVTNPNYSTKKFIFLLFINNRLVECQSLKRSIDQVYATYLPKNSHPFVYLSLELDPASVDVNVHPTKHEVHFFNEDQIIELIITSLETKLLGSNNSRTFYTTGKLPKITLKSEDKTLYQKEFVRTDTNEQKLTKFFGPTSTGKEKSPIKTTKLVDTSLSEDVFDRFNKDFIKRTESLEKETKKDHHLSKISRIEIKLTSVLELQKEIEANSHKNLRELFAQHVFVGSINPKQSLIQYNTKLFLCNTKKILQELFYQYIMYNFQNFDKITLTNPLPIYDLCLLALDLSEVGWTPEDGDKTELSQKVVEILSDKAEMLEEYFSMEIEDGKIKSLPLLIENYLPDMIGLPVYILRLASEVNWETEKDCFKSFAIETAAFYSELYSEEINEGSNWRWVTEHVLYPAIKKFFLPPKNFTENASVLQIADLPSLYKVFERC
nr:DNA mismatch repair protein Mlh1 [Onthophagus taurus]